MVKTSAEQKELEKRTENHKNETLDKYNIRLYSDEECRKLYLSELNNLSDYISKKVNSKKSPMIDDDDDFIKVNESKLKSKIIKTLSVDDYEKIFPKTTSYIKNNIYHGYDSMFYVLNKNSDGHILPLEYTKTNFMSTYGTYFEEHIGIWFSKYSRKVVLTIDNTQERIFNKNGTNYLNLFSGYKFSKNDKKDLARIEKGRAGVEFIWNHIYEIWNSGNKQCFEYDKKWIRKLINGFKMKTMLYLKGKMGRGKTTIVKFIMRVLGMHTCLTLSNDAPFMTEFNGSLIGISLCLLDVIIHDFNAFSSLYNKLKPYITDDTMAYRNLYEKLKQLMNLTSFIMSGNYDMLKLDDPTKGDDRRIKVSDVADVIKDLEYCKLLDAYLADEDVMYSFYWDSIDNYEEFNEGQELKLLPITETKKNMIVKSLDTSILFLKYIINDKELMNTHIKPKELYEVYCQYIKDSPDNKKFMLNKETFLEKLKDLKDVVKFEVKKISKTNPTNYIYINREIMVKVFTEKHYFNEYDDVNEKLEPVLHQFNQLDNGTPTYDKATQELINENLELKKQLEEMKQIIENLKSSKDIKQEKELNNKDIDNVEQLFQEAVEKKNNKPKANKEGETDIDDADIDAIMAELDNTYKKQYKSKNNLKL